ncbi:MAG: amidohydrolase family protein [Gemmatimonadetes bacterium]|nr:amidohydrolase family protein [Gemmatimonadota bacterium]
MIDVNAFLGAYPWRRVPGTSATGLIEAMDRAAIASAWVSHLPGLWWKDPAAGNGWLFEAVAREPRFRSVATIHPGLPGWEDDLTTAVGAGAVAVRADPGYLGLSPAGPEMLALVQAAGGAGIPLLAAVRLEDGRGRHPLDVAPELTPWAVRQWIRASATVRLVITHADRGFIEEVHHGSTPAEAGRIWWDISWVWGPPDDHLALLLATMGAARFLFGSGQPLRLAETPGARLDLLSLPAADRAAITHDNAAQLAGRRSPPA